MMVSMASGKRVAVIGAGFSGLSAAALLAREGFEVTVYEQNASSGGRAMLYQEAGFTFDMGPSWYLMPDVFERFLSIFGKRPEDLVELVRLDPYYRLFFQGQGTADIVPDLEANMAIFDSFESGGGERLASYLRDAARQYDLAMGRFVYREYSSFLDLMDPRLAIDGIRLGLFQDVDGYVSSRFKDGRSRKILEYTMVFLGGSPKNTPALYSIMSHVDMTLGVFYPLGGIGRLAKAMEGLARSQGAQFEFSQPVERILIGPDGQARGVRTPSGDHEADIVVSTADYHHCETELLPDQARSYDEGYWSGKVIAPSALLIYLGLGRKVKGLAHHNLFLADDWERHFDQIFKEPCWPDDPSYYVSCPSKSDPTVAPKGCDCLFILVPLSPGLTDDERSREGLAGKVLGDIGDRIGEDLTKDVLVRRIFSHRDFKGLYNAYKGNALGLSHTLFQTALWRPSHRSRKVPNLYHSGHYTHPGVGVPMCLISSQIVAQMVVDRHG